MSPLIVVLIIVAAVGLWIVGAYNALVRSRNRVKESWSDINVQLKRRYDLIPNLVETVKGYAKHEKETSENVMKARAGLIEGSVAERGGADSTVTQSVKSLFAVAEAYPNLKANENFLKLQEELVATENSIAFVRIGYNDDALHYNIALQAFPSSIIGNMFGFKPKEFFQAKEHERAAVKVDLK